MTKKKITPLSAVAAVLMLVSAVMPLEMLMFTWAGNFESIRGVFYWSFTRFLPSSGVYHIGTVLSYIAILIGVINALFVFLNKRSYIFTAFLVVCSISLFHSCYIFFQNPYFAVYTVCLLFIAVAHLAFGVISFLCIKNPSSKAANMWLIPLLLSVAVFVIVIIISLVWEYFFTICMSICSFGT